MPNQTSLEQIELAEPTQAVDDGRVATDPFKLIAATRTVLNDRLTDLKTKDAATLTTEASRATASANLRGALDQLRTLLKDGFNFVQGLGSFAITDANRLGVYTAYGWESGLVGDFTDARIESLANQAITATFAATALTLTAPAMPNHATTLRAYRRAAGGTAALAGTSATTTVSLVELGPLTSGVTYQFWLVGHNSQGEGPESNHVTHVAA